MKIAVIGDVHKSWDEVDADYFNAGDHDLIVFVGDLPGRSHREIEVARRISGLQKEALLIPGNHDAVTWAQFLAELGSRDGLAEVAGGKQKERVLALAEALGPVRLGGYSRHVFGKETPLDVIVARPHAMGGRRLSYRPYLREEFGVDSLEDSARLLRELIDQSGDWLFFLAHNGPSGLGEKRDSIWGRDFDARAGDFGDPDLEEALGYARSQGKQVVAVAAGHMHHALRGGGRRERVLLREGTVFINAARVPRIFTRDGKIFRHHVEVRIDSFRGEPRARVAEILVGENEEIRENLA